MHRAAIARSALKNQFIDSTGGGTTYFQRLQHRSSFTRITELADHHINVCVSGMPCGGNIIDTILKQLNSTFTAAIGVIAQNLEDAQ
ncbi:MAG: hypothetical protein ACSLE6_12355 [Mycobacterium sp.]